MSLTSDRLRWGENEASPERFVLHLASLADLCDWEWLGTAIVPTAFNGTSWVIDGPNFLQFQIDGAPVAATPEPSSVALMLAGIGLVFAMRKRWASGLQQAS